MEYRARPRERAWAQLAAARQHAGHGSGHRRDAAHPDRQPGPARLLLRPAASGLRARSRPADGEPPRRARRGLGPGGPGDRRARPRPHPGRAAERSRRRHPPGGRPRAARAPDLPAAPPERQDRARLAGAFEGSGRTRGAGGGALRRAARPRLRRGRDPRAEPRLRRAHPAPAAERRRDPGPPRSGHAPPQPTPWARQRSYLWAVTPDTDRELRAARPRRDRGARPPGERGDEPLRRRGPAARGRGRGGARPPAAGARGRPARPPAPGGGAGRRLAVHPLRRPAAAGGQGVRRRRETCSPARAARSRRSPLGLGARRAAAGSGAAPAGGEAARRAGRSGLRPPGPPGGRAAGLRRRELRPPSSACPPRARRRRRSRRSLRAGESMLALDFDAALPRVLGDG